MKFDRHTYFSKEKRDLLFRGLRCQRIASSEDYLKYLHYTRLDKTVECSMSTEESNNLQEFLKVECDEKVRLHDERERQRVAMVEIEYKVCQELVREYSLIPCAECSTKKFPYWIGDCAPLHGLLHALERVRREKDYVCADFMRSLFVKVGIGVKYLRDGKIEVERLRL